MFAFLPGITLATPVGPEYRPLSALSHVLVEMRYATAARQLGEDLYGAFAAGYLHAEAYAKLEQAAVLLQGERPAWKLLVLDALRPRSAQRRLFEKVRGTPREKYVAQPETGSVHNFGFAVDITLQDEQGREVDMGTPYADLTPLASPRHEKRYLAAGSLTAAQVANRRLLRRVMEQAGFRQLPIEWWHFDALPGAKVRATYKIVE